MQIDQAATQAEIEEARTLFQEFASWLGIDLSFQGFAEELACLPGLYARPHGRLLLARLGQEPVGCVALRPRGDVVGEMKRLFVRQAYQGQGLGRALAERVVAEARIIGYSSLVLDTLPPMANAIRLYEALGFVRRSAYYHTPLPETIFMELRL